MLATETSVLGPMFWIAALVVSMLLTIGLLVCIWIKFSHNQQQSNNTSSKVPIWVMPIIMAILIAGIYISTVMFRRSAMQDVTANSINYHSKAEMEYRQADDPQPEAKKATRKAATQPADIQPNELKRH